MEHLRNERMSRSKYERRYRPTSARTQEPIKSNKQLPIATQRVAIFLCPKGDGAMKNSHPKTAS
jgi:hypothetical protein